MPRRTATDRHRDTAPPPGGPELIEQLIAFHHPTRPRILEELALQGPSSVGQLAHRLGLAPGSVSHHLKPLHRAGFGEPAPELARDSRASWWRTTPQRLSYDATDYPAGSRAREVATFAERANDDRHVGAIRAWRSDREDLPREWQRAGGSTDSTVVATSEQVADLFGRLEEVMSAWSKECRVDAERHPDLDCRAVLAFAHAQPVARQS